LPLLRKKFLIAGFFFLVVNATVIDLVAFSLTPLSLIAPFAGMTIVFSALLAASGLVSGGQKEVIGRLDALVIGIILLGVTTASLFGPRSPEGEPPDMETMASYFDNPPFVAFSLVSSVIILSFVLSQFLAAGRAWINQYAVLKTFCTGFTAAGCGALSQMCLKIVSTALREKFNGRPALRSFAFFASLLGLAVFAPLQLVLLNRTLATSPLSYAVPLYQTMLIILTILAGGTFFLEFGSMDRLHGLLFTCGVLLATLGLCLLSFRKKTDVDVQSQTQSAKALGGMLDETATTPTRNSRVGSSRVRRSGGWARDSPLATRPCADAEGHPEVTPRVATGRNGRGAEGGVRLAAAELTVVGDLN